MLGIAEIRAYPLARSPDCSLPAVAAQAPRLARLYVERERVRRHIYACGRSRGVGRVGPRTPITLVANVDGKRSRNDSAQTEQIVGIFPVERGDRSRPPEYRRIERHVGAVRWALRGL